MSRFWNHFLNNGRPATPPGTLGLQGYAVPLGRRFARRHGITQASGVCVQAVEPRGPAEEAGVLEGDVLLTLAGRPTTSADELNRLLGQLPTDVPFSLVLRRNGRCLERLVLARPAGRARAR